MMENGTNSPQFLQATPASRFSQPSLSPSHVSRSPLLSLLEQGKHVALTLLQGPGGVGKSTLAVEWSQHLQEHNQLQLFWFSLESINNHPQHFFRQIFDGLRSRIPDFSVPLPDEVKHSSSVEPIFFVQLLLEELQRHDNGILLVFDDYHRITQEEIHHALITLVEKLPSQHHILLSTRVLPPFPIAEWQLKGTVQLFTQKQFLFSQDETRDFFQKDLQQNLPDTELQTIQQRTEGWIGSLKLLSQRIKAEPEFSLKQFPSIFSLSHSFLKQEVFSRQSPEMQEFLLQLSVFKKFSKHLCMTFLPTRETELLFHQLLQDDLFLVPLGKDRKWYRFHHLFHQALHEERQHRPEGNEWRADASRALLQLGLYEEAIEQFYLAEDYSAMAKLLSQTASSFLDNASQGTFLYWLEKLPLDEVQKQPILLGYRAWIHLFSGNRQETRNALRLLQATLGEIQRKQIPLESWLQQTLKVILLIGKKQHKEAFALFHQIKPHIPQDKVHLYWMLSLFENVATFHSKRDFVKAISGLEEVYEHCLALQNLEWAGACFSIHGFLYRQLGRTRQSLESCAELLERMEEAEQRQQRSFSSKSDVHEILGWLQYQQNQWEEAQQSFRTALQLARKFGQSRTELKALHGLTLLAQGQRKGSEARALIKEILRLFPSFQTPSLQIQQILLHSYKLLAEEGEPLLFSQWAQQMQLEQQLSQPYSLKSEYNYLMFASYCVLQGQKERARQILEPLHVWLSSFPASLNWAETTLLLAELSAREGKQEEVRERLVEVLPFLSASNYQSLLLRYDSLLETLTAHLPTFREARPSVFSLCEPYLNSVLQMHTQRVPSPAGTQTDPYFQDPLSRREMEILSCLEQGLSNKEISSTLFIAETTVKKHVSNIFSKLSVRNRRKAVVRARELQILS